MNQPYLIWAAALCRHVPPPRDQGWDKKKPIDKGACIVHDVIVVVVVDDDLELFRRSSAGQLKLNLSKISNCLN